MKHYGSTPINYNCEVNPQELADCIAELDREAQLYVNGSLLRQAQEFHQHIENSVLCFERRVEAAYSGFNAANHDDAVVAIMKRANDLYKESDVYRVSKEAKEELNIVLKKIEALKKEKERQKIESERVVQVYSMISDLYSQAFQFKVEILSMKGDEYKSRVNFMADGEIIENGVILCIDSKKRELVKFELEGFSSECEREFRKFYEESRNLPKLICKLRKKIMELHEIEKAEKL